MFYIEHANLSQIGHETLLACSVMSDDSTQSIYLSPRQKECLRLVAQGHTASLIAHQLKISIRMVHFHLGNAREKLGARSTAQAVHLASVMGLLKKED